MPETTSAHSGIPENGSICIHCGLCCDGTLFGKAKIHKHDDMAFLKKSGVELVAENDKRFFLQPCPSVNGTVCTLYRDKRRFNVCKTFKCKLLQQYLSGETSYQSALNTIKEVFMRRKSIRELSRLLPTLPDSTILTVTTALRQSGKMEDISFRRAYARQLLDCVILENLLQQRFYKDRAAQQMDDAERLE